MSVALILDLLMCWSYDSLLWSHLLYLRYEVLFVYFRDELHYGLHVSRDLCVFQGWTPSWSTCVTRSLCISGMNSIVVYMCQEIFVYFREELHHGLHVSRDLCVFQGWTPLWSTCVKRFLCISGMNSIVVYMCQEIFFVFQGWTPSWSTCVKRFLCISGMNSIVVYMCHEIFVYFRDELHNGLHVSKDLCVFQGWTPSWSTCVTKSLCISGMNSNVVYMCQEIFVYFRDELHNGLHVSRDLYVFQGWTPSWSTCVMRYSLSASQCSFLLKTLTRTTCLWRCGVRQSGSSWPMLCIGKRSSLLFKMWFNSLAVI